MGLGRGFGADSGGVDAGGWDGGDASAACSMICVARASRRFSVSASWSSSSRSVDPLGFRHEDAAAKQLHLLDEQLVGASQLVALGRHLRERRLRLGEHGFEVRDPAPQYLAIATIDRALDHKSGL